jgi:hypothetical protein
MAYRLRGLRKETDNGVLVRMHGWHFNKMLPCPWLKAIQEPSIDELIFHMNMD